MLSRVKHSPLPYAGRASGSSVRAGHGLLAVLEVLVLLGAQVLDLRHEKSAEGRPVVEKSCRSRKEGEHAAQQSTAHTTVNEVRGCVVLRQSCRRESHARLETAAATNKTKTPDRHICSC